LALLLKNVAEVQTLKQYLFFQFCLCISVKFLKQILLVVV